MEIIRTKLDASVFFALIGRLTVNVEAEIEALNVAAREISDPEIRGVFIDLENVTRLDCSGIGQLIRLRSDVVDAGRAFGLVNLDRDHLQLLEMLRVPAVCRIYRSRGAALRSFAALTSPRERPSVESGIMRSPVSIRIRSSTPLRQQRAATHCESPWRGAARWPDH